MKKPSLTKLFGLPSIASFSRRSTGRALDRGRQRGLVSALVPPAPTLLPTLLLGVAGMLFVSCSGTSPNQSANTASENVSTPESGAATATATPTSAAVSQDEGTSTEGMQGEDAGTGGQDPGAEGRIRMQGQRRAAQLEYHKSRARQALTERRFEDARNEAADALRVDPSDQEAEQLLQKAMMLLGESEAPVGERAQRSLLRVEIEKQRAEAQALKYEQDGDFLMEKEDFGEARRAYEKGLLTIRYSPWFTPGSEQEKRLIAKMEQAERARDELAMRVTERERRQSLEELAEANRAERLRVQRLVRRLFEEANLAFQNRQYGEAVTMLDRALAYDPLNQQAQDLRDLALRARHDSNMSEVQRTWRREWIKTFDDIHQGNVMQERVIEHDAEHWNEKVRGRKPLEFTNWNVAEDPDDEAVRKTLETVRVPSDFPEASLDEWVDYYRRATGLTFVISPQLRELGEEETGLMRFNLPLASVASALDLIARIRPIRWRVKDGVVRLQSAEESTGNIVPKIYDVREIINPIKQYPGKDLAQKFGEFFFEEELPEPEPVVVDMDRLQGLINTNVEPASWDREGVSIEPTLTALIINQTPEVHAKIDRLLEDLRKTSGLQVDIEARFLEVEDNFLEEIGVDFRGLGDQASAGVPGRGLEKYNRAGFGFDDYGRNVSSSDPGPTGTGFEPGFFYDDGRDGDIYGRTENLFDRALGGDSGLDNGGGASLQYTFLDDAEIEIILRAVSKKERVEQLSAPRLLIHNTARANLTITNQFTYIKDFNVEIAQAAAIADPVVDVIRDGVVLDVRPVVSADQRYILIELRPTLAQLAQPIPTFTTSLGAGQPVSIQLPQLVLQRVRTTVTIPDGGTLLLGGMKTMEKQRFRSTVPILGDLPLISFFFQKKGVYNNNRKILILLRAKVVVPSEWEPELVDVR